MECSHAWRSSPSSEPQPHAPGGQRCHATAALVRKQHQPEEGQLVLSPGSSSRMLAGDDAPRSSSHKHAGDHAPRPRNKMHAGEFKVVSACMRDI
eukprot:1139502-Pelagomonas_calceolata.AAC.7